MKILILIAAVLTSAHVFASPSEDTTLSPSEDTTLSPSEDTTLGIPQHAAKFIASGTTKDQLLGAIRRAGTKHNLRFSALVLESCNSQLAPDQLKSLPNVDWVFMTGTAGIGFTSLDYNKILSEPGQLMASSLQQYFGEYT